MALDTIAREDLETAVNDLRNAALVVEHAGHTRGRMLDGREGSVCAAAAVEIAAYRPIITLDGVGIYALCGSGEINSRADNAMTALADHLPRDLCAMCDDRKFPCEYRPIDRVWATVTHYNDAHCPGGDELATTLRNAADAAANEIADRRKILTGLPA